MKRTTGGNAYVSGLKISIELPLQVVVVLVILMQ